MRRAASSARVEASARGAACPRQDRSGSDRSTSSTPPRPQIGFPAVVKPEFGAQPSGPSGSTRSSRSPTSTGSSARRSRLTRSSISVQATTSCSRSTSMASSSTSTWSSKTASACSRASPRTGRRPSRRFRKPGFIARRTMAPSRSAGSWNSREDSPGIRLLTRGVLHVEGKCTSKGPRIVEVNARLGGGRIHQVVEAVWGVDLIEAQLRSALGLPQQLTPSRKPRCAVVNALVYAPATGRLTALPFTDVTSDAGLGVSSTSRLKWGKKWTGQTDLLDGARRGLCRRQEPTARAGAGRPRCCVTTGCGPARASMTSCDLMAPASGKQRPISSVLHLYRSTRTADGMRGR